MEKRKEKILQITLIVAALCSLGFVIDAGRHNSSLLLNLLFVVWVVAPFIGLLMVSKTQAKRPAKVQAQLFSFGMIISVSSLLVYSRLIVPTQVKPAAPFLIMPLLIWVALIFAFIAVKIRSASSKEKER